MQSCLAVVNPFPDTGFLAWGWQFWCALDYQIPFALPVYTYDGSKLDSLWFKSKIIKGYM